VRKANLCRYLADNEGAVLVAFITQHYVEKGVPFSTTTLANHICDLLAKKGVRALQGLSADEKLAQGPDQAHLQLRLF
jgi:hypothetical protein